MSKKTLTVTEPVKLLTEKRMPADAHMETMSEAIEALKIYYSRDEIAKTGRSNQQFRSEIIPKAIGFIERTETHYLNYREFFFTLKNIIEQESIFNLRNRIRSMIENTMTSEE